MRALLSAVLAGFWATSALAAGSSIQPTVPANNSPLSSAVLRNNFAAAYADINALIRDNAGISAPVNPVLGQKWLNTSSTPYFLNEWDGGAWVALGSLNATTHTWIVAPAGIPAPTSTTLGGVFSSSAATNQFVTGINTSGAITYAQPSFSNLSGTIASGQVSGAYSGITGVGTIATGAWNGSVIGAQFGGTGVANGAGSTLTLGGAVSHAGAFTQTFTATGNTSLTLPTAGTLATLSNNLGQFGSTTSAQLAGTISDETGTGSLVFGTSPTLAGTVAGTYTVGSGATWNGVAIGSQFGGLGANNSAASGIPVFAAGTSTVTAATGTGAPVRATSPTLVTPALGVATATSLTAGTLTATGMARVLATNTGGQSIPTGSVTTVTGWTTGFDAASNFVASTGVFTAPATSYYLVTCQLIYSGAAPLGTLFEVNIVANGAGRAVGVYGSDSATQTTNSVSASALVQLNSGQTVTIGALQNSGGAIPLFTGAAGVYLSITQMP